MCRLWTGKGEWGLPRPFTLQVVRSVIHDEDVEEDTPNPFVVDVMQNDVFHNRPFP